MKLSASIFLSFLLISWVDGQLTPSHFQQITAKEGLSQGHVLCMIQDDDGYIWAGTFHGLNRYNGYNFKVFYADDTDSTSLYINVVYSLYEASDGKIWCGTWGVDIYDPQTESFEHIPAYEGSNSLTAAEVRAILEDREGYMWFATQGGGLNRYNPDDKTIRAYRMNDSTDFSLQSDRINDIVLDEQNNLWIATEDGGLSRLNLTTGKLLTYRYDSENRYSIPSDKISSLFIDRDQTLWLGDDTGRISEYIVEKDHFISYECRNQMITSHARIMDIVQDREGNLLLATNGSGLISFNPLTADCSIYTHNPDDPGSLLSNENSSLLIDRNNTLFVGSFGRGISKYSPYSNKFDVFRVPTRDFLSSDVNSFTDAIEDSRGNLVVGSYHGFFVYNPDTWEYAHYLPGNSYEENKVLTLELAPDNTIWVCTMKGIHRYDRDYRKIRTYYPDPGLKDQSVYAIEFDHRNKLWLGLFTRGLIRIEETEWRDRSGTKLDYSIYLRDDGDTTSIPGNQQWIIEKGPDSGLWIGGIGGLARYNYEEDNFTRVFQEGTVKTFDVDAKGKFWIGTIGTGFYGYDPVRGDIERYTTEDGLNHSFIFSVIADPSEKVWISSEKGLSCFYPSSGSFRNYDIRDGLPSDHFDDKADEHLSEGRIYMGTNNGFIIFDPDEIEDDTSMSNVVLTHLEIDNKALDFFYNRKTKESIPIQKLKKILIGPSQRDIELGFAALHYSAPHRIRYKYMLEDYDNQWIYTDAAHRLAKYTNLNAGQYTFRVMATNSDGYWNDEPLEIMITVIPPFYKTRLFRLILLVTIGVLIYLIFRWRIVQEIRQKKILELKVEERTREIREKNKQLTESAEQLRESNTLLEEQRQQVEEQSEELASQRDELAHSNATKDRLFSIIAHDLKNPFNVILGYVDLLLIRYNTWNDEKKLQFLNLVKDTSENAFTLLENLLQWSKSRSGMMKFDPVERKVSKLIKDTLPDVRSIADKKSVPINITIEDPDELTVKADADMLRVILRNLLTNAIKFSNKGDEIDLEVVRHDHKFALFTIRDRGVGMESKDLENLFVFEKKASTSGTEGEKGSGLGLILCHEFVEHHGGRIWAESETGKGTTFRFTIPLKK